MTPKLASRLLAIAHAECNRRGRGARHALTKVLLYLYDCLAIKSRE
jgi:hypothetical protein